MWELWGVEISAFPFTWHIAYTTACCYRTSRDNSPVHGCHITIKLIYVHNKSSSCDKFLPICIIHVNFPNYE